MGLKTLLGVNTDGRNPSEGSGWDAGSCLAPWGDALLFRTHDHCLKRRLVVWLPEFPDRQENSESDREARRV